MTSNVGQIPWATRTDDYFRLDIRTLDRAGALESGQRVSWKVDQSALEILVDDHALLVQGKLIQIARTTMHFGGSRPWFVCPQCKERRAVLYIGPFTCRQCARIHYSSAQESKRDRPKRQAEKIRAQLKWPLDLLQPDGSKPKWMRWPTFHRLCARHAELKRRWLEGYL